MWILRQQTKLAISLLESPLQTRAKKLCTSIMNASFNRINAMEHPAYNTITLQEKLQMPEVRWAICKAIVASLVVFALSFCFAVISAWIMLAVPIWYREYDELYVDQWKETIGCSAMGKPWISIECKSVGEFSVAPSLEKTFERTLTMFIEENPHAKYFLVDLFKCHNAGRCKSLIVSVIELLVQTRIWVLIVSWIPTVWGAMLLIQRGVMPYWNKVWNQLTCGNRAEVQLMVMNREQQDKLTDSLLKNIVTPSRASFPTPTLPETDEWTTSRLHGAPETEDEEDDGSSTMSAYCVEDEKSNHRPLPRFRSRNPPPKSAESNAVGGRSEVL